MARLLFIFSAILGLLLIPGGSARMANNYLLSGETLGTDQQLNYDKLSFVMQGDCNLVLYNGGWQSNTANRGKDCTVSLNNDGQLVIKSGDGKTVWTSGDSSPRGNYAAVLHPEGKVVVYGPEVWSAYYKGVASDVVNSSLLAGGSGVGNTPMVTNLMFSGQVLYRDGKLTTRDYMFVMQGDCNLVLYTHGGWQSNTHGNGQHCFLRLDHRGMLTIKDDSYGTVWTSGQKSAEGEYVLILQEDAKVVVYGPAIWSTKSTGEKIAMVTV
uniref:Lectin n=1 Tax=Lysichiton camtschatcensis TaxID=174226 RepID=H1A7C5_LYSCA|nr:lectin [Lysichiton camtschatcensis]